MILTIALVVAVLAGLVVYAAFLDGDQGKPVTAAQPVLTATAAGPHTIKLSWDRLPGADSYALQHIDPSTGVAIKTESGIEGGQQAENIEKLAPATEYCFKLQAVDGRTPGPASDLACATTSKPPGPGATSSTGPGTVNSGPSTSPEAGDDTPKFARGQWIAVIDVYSTDSGFPAEDSAKGLAGRLLAAGVPAKALSATGQYPGLAKSDGEPMRDAWIVYVGPADSSAGARAICVSEQAQRAYSSPACPTYQPAKALGR
ncbi:MAG TPA: fibronectin type III domain-containing protein [Kribbella sp.]|nr:fibronectin type III domain-containing protein [Kribbella sp.]